MPSTYEAQALKIMAGMGPWFDDINAKPRKPKKHSRDSRTHQEWIFDKGVHAAAEFIRRLTKDENLSLAIHECATWKRQERAKESEARVTTPS